MQSYIVQYYNEIGAKSTLLLKERQEVIIINNRYRNVVSHFETAGDVEVLQGGEGVANDFLGDGNDPLYAIVQLKNHTEMQYVSTCSSGRR